MPGRMLGVKAFLGAESFPGLSVARGAGTSFVGQADFDGCIAFCNWDREDVAVALPAELVLADNTSTARDVHPIVFIFGKQREGATIFGGLTFPLAVSYHEFALAIPFVRHRRGAYLHTFVPRMYASFFPAMWAGNAHYGLAKEMASMQSDGSRFVIATPAGAALFHASVEPDGDWAPGAHCQLPNFAAMRAVFGLPILGRRSDGRYVSSYFGWDFSAARVRAARAALSIDAPLAAGLTPRECTALAAGTFDVRHMVWRLSWPIPCRF